LTLPASFSSTFPRATNFVAVGSRLPAFNTSAGRVLLAGKPETEVERLLAKFRPPRRVTPKAKINTEDILRAIQRARIDGYAVNDEEIKIGVSSVAVPVLAPTGAARAFGSTSSRADTSLALAVGSPRGRRGVSVPSRTVSNRCTGTRPVRR